MDIKRWLLYLCHIETLFVIGAIVLFLYIIIFRRGKGTIAQLEEYARDIVEVSNEIKSIKIDEKLIKKPKKIHKHEERCREIFQRIFKAEFKSVRPSWLLNPATNKALELDGYCPNIITPIGRGLAFEYDGAQHARFTPAFHTKPMDFVYQTKKDSWKDMRCKSEGIMLVRIPDFVAYDDLEGYIKQTLYRKGMGRYLNHKP